MRTIRCVVASVGLMLMAAPMFAGPRTTSLKGRRHASVRRASASGRNLRSAKHESAAPIPAERATAIQTALIKRGYLTGEPTGAWDPQTVSAMQKLQADNGWQSRLTPDARALIKLGLGGPEQTSDAAPQEPR